MKSSKIIVQGSQISIILHKGDDDFISLTDMAKFKDRETTGIVIAHWLSTKYTIQFIGAWEKLHNPNFNYGEFAIIKSQAGLNNYKISVKEWVQKTNAVGLRATTGRYGGTYAHKDIAFEFGMWISPEFKIYLIKEFQRLKNEESERLRLGWDVKRALTKINYRIHTDAIKKHIIPSQVLKQQADIIYANEADVLNMALFGKTAKAWRDKNSDKDGNIRDYADVTQLVVLANLEGINAELIKQEIPQSERLVQLNQTAISQMKSLIDNPSIKKLK